MILGAYVNYAQFPTFLTKYIVPRPHCLTLIALCEYNVRLDGHVNLDRS